MADKKWEDISSDEETFKQPKPQTESTLQIQQQKQRKASGGEEGEESRKPKQQYEKKKFPNKGDMIDEVKKMDNQQVAVNIFKVEESVVAKDIYAAFKDVQIMKIYKEQHRPGTFNLYFENHEHAIHFIKVAPRNVNGKNFIMRISNKQPTEDKSEWNEMGGAGKLVKNFRPNNKYYDKPPQRKVQTYNRKEVENVYAEDASSRPVKEQQQEEEQKQERKPQQQQQQQHREKKDSTGEDKSYQKRGFHKGPSNAPLTKGPSQQQRQQDKEAGFQTVQSGKDRSQQKKHVEEPKQQQQEEEDDGFTTVGGKQRKQYNNNKKQGNK